MKKNKVMRIASILMVAALVSTCAISGTFAKYVTGDSADDAARVAKFGVTVLASGALYSDTYKAVTTPTSVAADNIPGTIGDNKNINAAAGTKLSVVSATFNGIADNWGGTAPNLTQKINGITGYDHVVAPGTKNNDGLVITFTGTPEVAVEVKMEKNDDYANEEIYLKKTSSEKQFYGVMVKVTVNDQNDFDRVLEQQGSIYYVDTADGKFKKATAIVAGYTGDYYVLHDTTETDADTFAKFTEDYYPVLYKLLRTSDGEELVTGKRPENASDTTNKFKLADVFESIKDAVKFSANTNLATTLGSYKLTWEWDYEEKAAKADLESKKTDLDTAKDALDAAQQTYENAYQAYMADTTDTALEAAKNAAEQALNAAVDTYREKYDAYVAAKALFDHYDHMDTILGDMIADSRDDLDYVVVRATIGIDDVVTAEEIKYASVTLMNGEELHAPVEVAYIGETEPTVLNDASIVAVLSTSFGVDVTVTQID